jgi:hypothetical protein
MGAKQVGPQYTPLPADFQKQRGDIWNYLGKDIGQNLPAYGGDLKAPNQLMDAGKLVSWLLTGNPNGGFDPSTGKGPMGRGGSFPGDTGMGGMPMPTGWGTLGKSVSTEPGYQANLAKTRMNIDTGANQALQAGFGSGGSTQGTGMMRILGDVGARNMTDFQSGEMERQRQSEEAAMGRRQWMAGEENSQANQRAALGMGYSQAYQASQMPAYEEWKRQQYQNSPQFSAINAWGSSYPQQPQIPDMMESPLMGIFKSFVGAGGQVAGAAAGNPKK